MIFKRHRRIKLLSRAAFEKWGDVVITFYARENGQRVTDLDGQTFNLAANGSIRKDKLDKKSIFDENVDGTYRRARLTLPALEPGSVIEYRYTVTSTIGRNFLEDWTFQTSEPTRWSEFRAGIPSVLQYVRVQQGLVVLAVNETDSYPWPPTMQGYATAREFNLKINTHRWAMRDIPALREEPYMTTPEDYRAKINFQLAQVAWPNELSRQVMNTWEKLAEDLMTWENFGGQIERHKILREQAEKLVAGLSNAEQKMRALYDYVRTTINWNDERGIVTKTDLDKAFQARRGSGPEIALMLTAMLRFAGLEAHPVLISTRENGQPIQLYPILGQFNHVLTQVKIGAQEYLLDATEPLRPHRILPVATLNGNGWLVHKKTPRWINIPATGSAGNVTTVQAELTAAGAITGRLMSSDAGYSALADRRKLRDKKTEAYIRENWFKDFAEAKLDSFQISNQDSTHQPLGSEVNFSLTDYAQIAGDNIYFNPILFDRHKENPFKRPERAFPVDFAYPRKLTYTLNLTLPDGYTVQEMPKNLTIMTPKEGAQFRRLTFVDGKNLQVMNQFTIRKPRFEPGEYGALRELYDQMVAAHAEQVVLKRGSVAADGKDGPK